LGWLGLEWISIVKNNESELPVRVRPGVIKVRREGLVPEAEERSMGAKCEVKALLAE